MSNQDNNETKENQIKTINNVSGKNNIHLFSFSGLKSKNKFFLSQYNYINYHFSKKKYLDLKENKNLNNINKRKIKLIDEDNNSYLQTLDFEVPSLVQLLEKQFQIKFFNEYDDSFANFCGINNFQFIDLYINNKYIPMINEFGDLHISVNNIIKFLKEYSHSLRLKRKRRLVNKYRINKKINTFENKNNKKRTKNYLKKRNKLENDENKNQITKINENINSFKKDLSVQIIQKNNSFPNLKNNLEIKIEKTPPDSIHNIDSIISNNIDKNNFKLSQNIFPLYSDSYFFPIFPFTFKPLFINDELNFISYNNKNAFNFGNINYNNINNQNNNMAHINMITDNNKSSNIIYNNKNYNINYLNYNADNNLNHL